MSNRPAAWWFALGALACMQDVQAGGPQDIVVVQAGHLLDVDSGRMLADQAVLIKLADLVAVACDPLHDVDCLRQVRGVIKAGQFVSLGRDPRGH